MSDTEKVLGGTKNDEGLGTATNLEENLLKLSVSTITGKKLLDELNSPKEKERMDGKDILQTHVVGETDGSLCESVVASNEMIGGLDFTIVNRMIAQKMEERRTYKRHSDETYEKISGEDGAQFLKRLCMLEGESKARTFASLGYVLKSIVKFSGNLSTNTDTEALESAIRKIEMESLLWKSFKYIQDENGERKFEISCVLQQDKVSIFVLRDVIKGISENIQSICISEVDHRTHPRLVLAQKPIGKEGYVAAMLNTTP